MSGIPVQQDFFTQGPSGFLRVSMPQHEAKTTVSGNLNRFTGQSAGVLSGPGQARTSEPDTAKAAAGLIAAKSGSARVLLLGAYLGVDGLTDEEAAERAGVSLASEYATRISELVRYQMVEPTGEERPGRSGVPRRVCRITDYGRHVMGARTSK